MQAQDLTIYIHNGTSDKGQYEDTIQVTKLFAPPIMNLPIVVIPLKREPPLYSGQNDLSCPMCPLPLHTLVKNVREEREERWREPGKYYHVMTVEATPLKTVCMYKKRGVASTT